MLLTSNVDIWEKNDRKDVSFVTFAVPPTTDAKIHHRLFDMIIAINMYVQMSMLYLIYYTVFLSHFILL